MRYGTSDCWARTIILSMTASFQHRPIPPTCPGDALRQVHRVGTGRTPQRPAPTSISTNTGRRTPASAAAASIAATWAASSAHTATLADARQRGETCELRGTHHLVAHQDVGNAAPGERLGLRHLLHALPDRATRHLQPGDYRRLVRLGMRPQLRPGRRKQFRHVVEVRLECIEIDQQRGRIDFVLAHAGSGWRWLQHGVLFPWPATGGSGPRCDPGMGRSLAVRRGHDNPFEAIGRPLIRRQSRQRARWHIDHGAGHATRGIPAQRRIAPATRRDAPPSRQRGRSAPHREREIATACRQRRTIQQCAVNEASHQCAIALPCGIDTASPSPHRMSAHGSGCAAPRS